MNSKEIFYSKYSFNIDPESRDSPFNHSSKKVPPSDRGRVKPFIPAMGYNSKADHSIDEKKPQTLVRKILRILFLIPIFRGKQEENSHMDLEF